MIEHDGSPAPSLIQQRMEIDRARMAGVWLAIAGVSFFVAGLAQLILSTSDPILPGGFGAIGLVAIVIGVVQALRARARMRRFEEENGVGAGRRDR